MDNLRDLWPPMEMIVGAKRQSLIRALIALVAALGFLGWVFGWQMVVGLLLLLFALDCYMTWREGEVELETVKFVDALDNRLNEKPVSGELAN